MTVTIPRTDPAIRIDYNRRDRELVLITPFSERATCSALSSRRWDKKTNTWRVPMILPNAEEVARVFEGRATWTEQAMGELSKLRSTIGEFMALKDRLDITAEDTGYRWRTRPFNHQASGTAAILARDRVCVFDEMGLGKSKEVIDAAVERLRRRQCSRVVVLCPTSLKFNWGGDEPRGILGEIQKHALEPYGEFSGVLVVDGSPKKRAEQLATAFEKQWIIINYELAKIHSDLLKQLAQDQYLVCDEAHRLKNIKTQTYKTVKSLRPRFLNLLSGTPVANTPVDVYALADLTEPGLLGASYGAFVKRFTRKGGFEGREIVGYKDLNEVRARVKTISIRRRKDILEGLPPKVYETRIIEMAGDQKKEYIRMRDDMVAFYRAMPEEDFLLQAPQAITQLLRLQQIADGFLAVADRTPQWYNSQPKLDALDEIVEEVCEREKKKLVIWSRFKPVTDFVAKRYAHLGSVRMSGEIGAKDRSEIVNRFRTQDDCKVFVSQVHTGGLGLTLTEANTQVFIDRWWSPAVNEQAEDRLHRIGTKGTVLVVTLMCRESIDENVMRMLHDKRRWADEVTGDKSVQLSKSDVLNLLGA